MVWTQLGMNSVMNFEGFITIQGSTDYVPQGSLSDQWWPVCESDCSAVVQTKRSCTSAPPTTPPTIWCVGGAVRNEPSHWLRVTYHSPEPQPVRLRSSGWQKLCTFHDSVVLKSRVESIGSVAVSRSKNTGTKTERCSWGDVGQCVVKSSGQCVVSRPSVTAPATRFCPRWPSGPGLRPQLQQQQPCWTIWLSAPED